MRVTSLLLRPSPGSPSLDGAGGLGTEVTWAAVVLTGGRARRLGGTSKADLVVGGRTLLASTYDACRDLGAQVVVVVGPEPDEPSGLEQPGGPRLVWTREDPPFAGPARAVAAGVAALAQHATVVPGAAVAVLACDMPQVGAALHVLARAVAADGGPVPGQPGVPGTSADPQRAAPPEPDGAAPQTALPAAGWWSVLGTSAGPGGAQVQWLLGIHRWELLRDACAALSPDGSGESVRELLAPSRARRVPVPDAAAADIDTWTDLHTALHPSGRATHRQERTTHAS